MINLLPISLLAQSQCISRLQPQHILLDSNVGVSGFWEYRSCCLAGLLAKRLFTKVVTCGDMCLKLATCPLEGLLLKGESIAVMDALKP